tara:strand:- start:213 stop:521 length:309 start_codon:yes stop_codon:yes gene_type:complete
MNNILKEKGGLFKISLREVCICNLQLLTNLDVHSYLPGLYKSIKGIENSYANFTSNLRGRQDFVNLASGKSSGTLAKNKLRNYLEKENHVMSIWKLVLTVCD